MFFDNFFWIPDPVMAGDERRKRRKGNENVIHRIKSSFSKEGSSRKRN